MGLLSRLFGGGEPEEPTQKYAWFMKRRQFNQALAVVDALLKAAPEVAMSWRAKGECLFEMNRFNDAIPCFARAAELGGPGTEDVLIWKAFCHQNLGQKEDARTQLQSLIESSPDPAVAAKAAEVLEAFEKE